MSGDAIGTAIAIGATVIMYAAVFTQIGPFAKVYAGLETLWRALRAGLHDLSNREAREPVIQGRRPYLTAEQVEELEIECYVGPYAEPFRADSIRAYAIAKMEKLGDCFGNRNRDVHHWRTFQGLEGFHTKCLRCGRLQERTEIIS